jgi:hypothetical protein
VNWEQSGRDSSDLRCRGEYRRGGERKTESGDGLAELLHASPLNVNIVAAILATATPSLAGRLASGSQTGLSGHCRTTVNWTPNLFPREHPGRFEEEEVQQQSAATAADGTDHS